jgi:hypothetical protein
VSQKQAANRRKRREWMRIEKERSERLAVEARRSGHASGHAQGMAEMMRLREPVRQGTVVTLGKPAFDAPIHQVRLMPMLSPYATVPPSSCGHIADFALEPWGLTYGATQVRWWNIVAANDKARENARPMASRAFGNVVLALERLRRLPVMRGLYEIDQARDALEEAAIRLGEWLPAAWPTVPGLVEKARALREEQAWP